MLKKIGLSFHVGSQCMHPISYSKGITEIGNIIKKTKILPDYINIGGVPAGGLPGGRWWAAQPHFGEKGFYVSPFKEGTSLQSWENNKKYEWPTSIDRPVGTTWAPVTDRNSKPVLGSTQVQSRHRP